jgi:hypothetical protein
MHRQLSRFVDWPWLRGGNIYGEPGVITAKLRALEFARLNAAKRGLRRQEESYRIVAPKPLRQMSV